MNEARKSGISFVDEVPWGTHFCQFYDTKTDLLEILIPYFKTGLENNEFCIWVLAESLNCDEALEALRTAVPDTERLLKHGIEIIPHTEWYLRNGSLDLRGVSEGWNRKLKEALSNGLAGIRVSGDGSWAGKKDWQSFSDYERDLNQVIADQRILALCTYAVASTRASEILDVARTHEFAVAKRGGRWDILESVQLKEAKVEIQRLKDQLEQRVIDRTHALQSMNEALRKEISERQRVEEDLRKQKEILQKVFDYIPAAISLKDSYDRFTLVNKEWERILGWSLPEIQGVGLDFFSKVYPDPAYRQEVLDLIARSDGKWSDFRSTTKDGGVVDASWASVRLLDGSTIAIGKDITERKRAEEKLQETLRQVRALTARHETVREEEKRFVAREIHDQVGQVLTAIKMDLKMMCETVETEKKISRRFLAKELKSSLRLIDKSIGNIRKVAAGLRSDILEHLGLKEAIISYAKDFEKRTSIHCRVASNFKRNAWRKQSALAVFRIFQEALTNVARHSKATKVWVKLNEEGEHVRLQVRDNGIGMKDAGSNGTGSLGILGMQERALLLGGLLKIVLGRKRGTTLNVTIPIANMRSAKPKEK